MTVDLAEVKRKLAARKSALLIKKGSRDQLIRDRDAELDAAKRATRESVLAEEAHLWILTEIVERREKGMRVIESTAASSLAAAPWVGAQGASASLWASRR